ncbi:hypothetical protein niasHT_019168 [Heterodera trifolii]|uniref:Uncharacterized protein n=1 Tax=Heterodera trifolii TaxID=157864 RepID=A0ABD2LD63_9BILA
MTPAHSRPPIFLASPSSKRGLSDLIGGLGDANRSIGPRGSIGLAADGPQLSIVGPEEHADKWKKMMSEWKPSPLPPSLPYPPAYHFAGVHPLKIRYPPPMSLRSLPRVSPSIRSLSSEIR